MRTTVLDASALLTMFFGEEGMEEMRTLFHKASTADKPLLISAINWAEVLNRVTRWEGAAGLGAAKELAASGAAYKAADRLGLADAFAAALAKIRKADLVTADREFKSVDGEIKIVWLK
jgi:predicted nucleic acid-binding protein